MIVFLDVDYREPDTHHPRPWAVSAAVALLDWADHLSARETVVEVSEVKEYIPGQFYKRELPCLLAVLEESNILPQANFLVVDSFVWLGNEKKPGMGAKLFQALDQSIPVIGLAKTSFAGAGPVIEHFRAESAKPLYLSSVGVSLEDAQKCVAQLHGNYRIPTLLKRVDTLARRSLLPADRP